MAAGKLPLTIYQGETLAFDMKFVQQGAPMPISDIQFVGKIKDSIYDEQGYDFRFKKIDENTIRAFFDAHLSESIEFTKGVYDIKMIQVDGFNTRLLEGEVVIDLGVTDATDYV